MRAPLVSVLIDLPPEHAYHRASVDALRHAASSLDVDVDIRVQPTNTITSVDGLIRSSSAILVGPGSPYRDPDAAIECIKSAREAGLPLVGT